jgi:protein TonB
MRESTSRLAAFGRAALRRTIGFVGAVALTLLCFLVLPVFQSMQVAAAADTLLTSVDTLEQPPPPEAEQEEPEPERPPEEKPPELEQEAPPLDLAQLELALNPGGDFGGGGWLAGDFATKLGPTIANTEAGAVEELFSMGDFDEKPRAVHTPEPTLTPQLRKRAPGKVNLIFFVDPRGRPENVTVDSSSDPIFEAAAVAAVKQWRFEPGKRKGEAVRYHMRVTITFPK